MMIRLSSFSFVARTIAAVLLLAAGGVAAGAENNLGAALPSYRLYPRDLVRVSIYGEPDLAQIDRRIDGRGEVSLPLVGSVALVGLTVAAAEDHIRQLYMQREIFIHPNVSVSVIEYSPKEIYVIGQVIAPGKIVLPIETDSLDIVDVIGRAGGIARLGRFDSVRVTRQTVDGAVESFTIDVRRIANSRGGTESFRVLPGDTVYVPERIL